MAVVRLAAFTVLSVLRLVAGFFNPLHNGFQFAANFLGSANRVGGSLEERQDLPSCKFRHRRGVCPAESRKCASLVSRRLPLRTVVALDRLRRPVRCPHRNRLGRAVWIGFLASRCARTRRSGNTQRARPDWCVPAISSTPRRASSASRARADGRGRPWRENRGALRGERKENWSFVRFETEAQPLLVASCHRSAQSARRYLT